MLTEIQREQLRAGAAHWGIVLDQATMDLFAAFTGMLEAGNQRLNLTRVPPEEVVPLHYLDSLALVGLGKPSPGSLLLDVGTGAGFPGLPLALVFPGLTVTLMDGTRKRLAFLDEAIATLALSNVRTLHGRAEELALLPAHREKYDIVTARAVARMPQLAAWLLPLIRVGGYAVAYKSLSAAEEIAEASQAVALQGGQLEKVADVSLPNTDIIRKLVLMRKVRPSPDRIVRASVRGKRR